MATKKEAAAEGEAGSGKKSKSTLMIIIIVLLLLVLGGGGAGYWLAFVKDADTEEDSTVARKKKKQKGAEAPVFVSLDAFTVNLQGEDNQLLQTAITLQVDDEEEATRLKQHMPLVRSRLVLLLSSKNAEDILTAEGKNKLAEEIAEQVKQPFSPRDFPMEVHNVLFTSFIVQ